MSPRHNDRLLSPRYCSDELACHDCDSRLTTPRADLHFLASQLRGVADTANAKKVAGRTADLKVWRQMLAQFIPTVIRECRHCAEIGKYECRISLSALLKASHYRECFPETRVMCWRCQRSPEHVNSSIVRGCFFSMQPDNVLDAPAKLDVDVTDFVTAVEAVVRKELEGHGFTVEVSNKTFTVACVHLALFTPTRDAPDLLKISWGSHGDSAQSPRRQAQSTARSVGNLIMRCGICHEDRPMQTIVPCGHLLCASCWSKSNTGGMHCPFCRGHVYNVHPLYVP